MFVHRVEDMSIAIQKCSAGEHYYIIAIIVIIIMLPQ